MEANTNEIIGIVMGVGVPLLVSLIALIKPIINLNSSITKLNVTMKQLIGENGNIKAELKEHEETLNDHEKRLYLMEHKSQRGDV